MPEGKTMKKKLQEKRKEKGKKKTYEERDDTE